MSRLTGPAPMEGGGDAPATERTSATPADAPLRLHRSHARRAPARSIPLAEAQGWFLAAISHPGTLEQGIRAAGRGPAGGLLTDGPALDAVERLRTYHHAYRARLVDCLADDFPGLRHALGPERFARLAEAVIAASPSRGPNLNSYGRALVEHLRGRPGRLPHRAFCADLATLEWALVEAIHAAPAEALDPAALGRLRPGRWADVRFTPSPSLRVLVLDHPVNPWFQAWLEERAVPIPRRRPSATAVYRRGFAVWRMDLAPEVVPLLEDLLGGTPLGAALAPYEGRVPPERVMRWFTGWVSAGFFASAG